MLFNSVAFTADTNKDGTRKATRITGAQANQALCRGAPANSLTKIQEKMPLPKNQSPADWCHIFSATDTQNQVVLF